MLIVSVKSSKISWIKNLNEANKAPIIGSLFLACIFMFPTLILQYFVELIFGDEPLFDLSFIFFWNTFFIHLFLKFVFDITVKFFFISSLIWCALLMVFHFFNEKELLLQYF